MTISLPDLSKASQKLDEIQVKINRLNSQKTALKTKEHRAQKSTRRARTRTLIQAGGLLDIAGLLALCDLQTGNDLQLDPESFDKSCVLLGILEETLAALPPTLSDAHIHHFKKKGLRRLKMASV